MSTPRTIRQLIAAKNRPDTALEIAERKKRIADGEQAHAETLVKFGVITGENVAAALEFQRTRMEELGRV